ncbi:MAG: Fe-S cluster assembly protein SufD [Planctomycetota bacterium]
MTTLKEAGQKYLSDFEAAGADGDHAWLRPRREAAIRSFGDRGFPTRKDELWRYTNVAPLVDAPFSTPAAGAADQAKVAELGLVGGTRLVFVNGLFAAAESRLDGLPAGVTLGGLAAALASDGEKLTPHLANQGVTAEHAFGELNTAFFRDGAFLHVAAGVEVAEPIELLFIGDPASAETVAHVRNLIVCEAGSRVTFVEVHQGVAGAWCNQVTEVDVAANSNVEHVKVQLDHDDAFHVSGLRVRVAEHGHFGNHFVSMGGRLVRNDIEVSLDGEWSNATLNGVFVVDGNRHVDTNTLIQHRVPNCTSHELYKGILAEKGRGVFRGKIHVHLDAQKTDAKQSSSNLLLSDDAVINTQPNLEIYADDVRCTHGATIGQLDAEAMFYLQSRGLSAAAARRLLTLGFVNDMVDQLPVDAVRELLESKVSERLAGVGV